MIMKKIIFVLLATSLLFSCTNTENTEIENTWAVEESQVDQENTSNTEELEDSMTEENNTEEDNSSDSENTEELEDTITQEDIENEIIKAQNDDIVTDEEALEAEVNDLLDEFIDSLDSYDK